MRMINEIKFLFGQRGYNLLSTEYLNNKQYLVFEKNGYKYYNTYNGFIKSDNFKKWSSKNPYSIENINLYLKENDISCKAIPQEYNYDNMKFQCSCGNIYEASLSNVIKTQHFCPKCGRKHSAINHRKDKIFFEKLDELNLSLLDEYHGMKCSYYFKTYDGYIFKSVARNLINIDNLQLFYYHINNKYSLQNMKLYLKQNHPKIKLLSLEYKGAKETYQFQCACGNTFHANWQWFLRGIGTKCPQCTKKISSLELKTKEWLEENNIKYIPQKIFEECKDINLLRFDFYLPDYDSVIEVDGSQHYFPVNFNGDMDKAKENFEKNKKHDIIKDDFCKKYNIKILRLPYFDFDKNDTYKEKLQTFIS